MTNFDLAGFGIGSICPGNELLYDDVGLPSVMVRVPKMTLSQLGMGDSTAVHPAFIVNGKEVDEIWISKFQNVVHDGRAYSLPARDPTTYITWEDALAACTAKGGGWHLMTRMERGALMRWCESNGFIPNGNNCYGRDYNEAVYKAIPSTRDVYGDGINHTYTGTGSLTWNHDGEASGICDLKGNVWEWAGGIRVVYGEIQILQDNNGADSDNSQLADSSAWKAIDAATGALVTPDGSGTTEGSVKINHEDNVGIVYSATKTTSTDEEAGYYFRSVTCDDTIGDNAKLLLRELGILKYSDDDLIAQERTSRCFMATTYPEYMLTDGGAYYNLNLGFASYGYGRRIGSSSYTGFRSAYVDLP